MPTIKTFIACLLAAFPWATGSAWAQGTDSSGNGISVSFLKKTVEIEENAFQFNSCAIVNHTSVSRTVRVDVDIPSYINLISSLPSNEVEIGAGETYYLPLRFNTKLDTLSTRSEPLKVTATSEGLEATGGFQIFIRPFYRWRCGLQQPEIVVQDNVSRYTIEFFLENLGNVPDEFEFNTESSSNITLVKKPEKIILKAGEFRIIKLEANIRFSNTDLNSSLNLYIRNKSGDKKLLLQKFTRVGSLFNQKVYAWARFPLTMEVQAQNLGTGNAFYSAGLYGTIELAKERRLSLFFVSDNYYKDFRSKSAMGYVSYQTKKNRLNIGNIQDSKQFFIVGNGLEFHHFNNNKGTYRFSAIQSRLEDVKLFSFSTEQSLAKKFSLLSDNFVHIDKYRETNSYLSIGSVKWEINRYSALTVSTGGGIETVKKAKYNFDTSLRGGMAGYDFEMRRKTWSTRSKINYYSKNIPGFNKGFVYHMHELKKPFGNNSVSLFHEVNKKVFNQTYDSLVKLLFNVSNRETGVRSALMKNNFSVNNTLSVYNQQQDSASSPVARMLRMAVNMNWMINNGLTISLYSNAGRVTVPEMPNVKPYIAFTNFGGVQFKKLGFQFRLDYRPFNYFEIKQYAHVPDSFRYLQLMPYIEHTFKKYNTTYRFTVNHTNDKALGYKFVLFSNEITYSLPDRGLEMRLTGQYNTVDKRNSFINIKLRKNLAVPAYKARSSYNFDLVLFKDINGNDVYDDGDQLIPGAEILVNSILVNSNKSGVIEFRNIGDQTFEIDFSKIRNIRGWMAKAGHKQTLVVMPNEKKIYIPFRESRGIRGSIRLIADEKSNKRISLSHIRVTATDQKGASFSTLTDINNEFFFDLPAGIYQVMINHGVFDEEFRPAEISKQVDLVNNNIMEIQFEVRQRKRQINIKHDDDDEEEEEE